MTNVIQFPNNKPDEDSKQVVKVNKSNKKTSILMASLFSLVMALSIVNSKLETSSNSSTKGMRGLASVNDTNFDKNNKNLIKLINSENSRKIASFGNPSKVSDELMFGDLAGKFHITRGSSNYVTSVERIQDGSNENEIQFEELLLNKYKRAFGAVQIQRKESGRFIANQNIQLVYNLINTEGEMFAEAKVVTSNVNELRSITILKK